jgi:hypothetical protein
MLKKASSRTNVVEYLDSGDESTEKSMTLDEDADENVSSFVPSTTLHTTPNERDFDAANILADLHLLCA